MELISNEKKEKENKGRKIIIGALILSVILIILVLILILVLEQKENDKIKLIVDGEKKTFNEELMVTDPNSNISYFSISQVANLVGYNYFNGEYKKYSEDKTKCYVESKN